ncbi:glycoside hydrolase family 2 protein [Dysgonomonas sp. HGC4]|uniref:glycoside hydrolase family 2 protein n=1 Tax=Dysgonomonas sp. HGC4 TaxID=1658009 RepID=UPI0006827001|nr:glycoside hydrolase family 2 [Dysgonomonas sp. HGC4]MBD8347876.1 glycoside hydrolase family 2 [Dysgonomonas sp. HGC4]
MNRKFKLSIFLLSFTLSLFSQDGRLVYKEYFAPSEGFVNRTEKDFRKEICLNGSWDIQPVDIPTNYIQGKGIAPTLPLPSNNGWDKTKIKIPSPWNINAFANRNLEGPDHRNYPSYPKEWENVKMAWMRKSVVIPSDWSGKQIKLHFEAVAGFTEVYVNNKKVGENFDLFLPFDIDITDNAAPGQTLEVLVGVRDQSLFEDNSTVGRRIVPAGSMWGYLVRGIWQDVYLVALPKIHVKDIFIKPQISKNVLELEVTIENNSTKKEEIQLGGLVNEWLNRAGTDVNSAPVPNWKLGQTALIIPESKLLVEAGSQAKAIIRIPVKSGDLEFWTPEHPNLYALRLTLNNKKQTIDSKYERFGWREWTFDGTKQCLNGKPIELKGDSWHFMGVPQLTRRYAWAWFTAIKGMNGNAVRPHAQVYPRFYLDVADEMGICVLNETANWASDGGPKLDSEKFWEASKKHLEHLVLRDRNHASVFGWSISNENKPVILHVYNKPELMPLQKKAWEEWRDIVIKNDPTRPWISADGEDDGDGILPTTVGHYGDLSSMKRWVEIGKPWGIGEHSMAYYGTPEQVSKYNGERAYESQLGRMEGLANECYNLIANQRQMGASYASVFNMAWYALKPLPIGKKDLTTAPSSTEDGVYFADYKEGTPGVQPERMGPYCTTFNPGYDPSLPLYAPWPMYEALRAANAPGEPAWSPYKDKPEAPSKKANLQPLKLYKEVIFIGKKGSRVKQIMDAQGVKFSAKITSPQQLLFIIDGTTTTSETEKKMLEQNIEKGADIWIWGIVPTTLSDFNKILPLNLTLKERKISSFIPENKSWMIGLNNSDFYFCEIQNADASQYGMGGMLVNEGDVILNACNTDWRKWNKRAEELKTAAVLRSENEYRGSAPAFVKYSKGCSTYYISTLTEFANSKKGFNTLENMLKNAGIPYHKSEANLNEVFFLRDGNLQFPAISKEKFVKNKDSYMADFWVWSPRPLDDLLIEPNMPKLTLFVDTWSSSLLLNDKLFDAAQVTNRNSTYKELPLLQGWNKVTLKIGEEDKNRFNAYFKCDNSKIFLPQLKISFVNPEVK